VYPNSNLIQAKPESNKKRGGTERTVFPLRTQ
jgi:hypothetical protein